MALDLGTDDLLGVPFIGLSLVHTKELDKVSGPPFLVKYVSTHVKRLWFSILHLVLTLYGSLS